MVSELSVPSYSDLQRWSDNIPPAELSADSPRQSIGKKTLDTLVDGITSSPHAMAHPLSTIVKPTAAFLRENWRFAGYQVASFIAIELPKIYYMHEHFEFNGPEDVVKFLALQPIMSAPSKVGGALIYLGFNLNKGKGRALREYGAMSAASFAATGAISPGSTGAILASMATGMDPGVAYAGKTISTLPIRLVSTFFGLKAEEKAEEYLSSHGGLRKYFSGALQSISSKLSSERSPTMGFSLDPKMLNDERNYVQSMMQRQLTNAYMDARVDFVSRGFI